MPEAAGVFAGEGAGRAGDVCWSVTGLRVGCEGAFGSRSFGDEREGDVGQSREGGSSSLMTLVVPAADAALGWEAGTSPAGLEWTAFAGCCVRYNYSEILH